MDGSVKSGRRPSVRVLMMALLGLLAPLVLAVAQTSRAAVVPLYPDLKTLPPRDLRFATVNVSSDPTVTQTDNVLQFSNTTYNAGEGVLDLRATIDTTKNPPSGTAIQRVYDSGGGYTDYTVGSMYYHAVHQHYHYDGWGRYELWNKSDWDAYLASGRTTTPNPLLGSKTTSCVLDEEYVQQLSGTPYPGRFGSGGCQLDSTNTLHMGESPGWGDTYDWYRFEQWIDLGPNGSLADGQYVLRSVADPNNQIYESPSKSDSTREGAAANEATTPFTISGGQIVDTQAPTGSLALNGVAASTTSPNVTAYAVGRDDVSGVTAFRLSNDGSHWGPSISYTTSGSVPTTTTWNITNATYGGTAAAGTKTVYAQFLDAAGRWGPATTDTIGYTTATGSTAYSSAVLADKPAGYWRLGEGSGSTAADAMGTNNGTYQSGAVLGQPSLVPSQTDTAAAAGSVGVATVPSSTSLSPTTALSVESWFKPNALPSAGAFASLVTKRESYSLQMNGPRLEFTLMNSSGTRFRLQAPSGAVVAGSTYYVVGTWDGTTQRLYLNGTLVASQAPGMSVATTSNALQIGSWDGTSSEALSGTLDEAAVYPTTLSATQVANHWAAATSSSSPSPSPSATSASPTPTPTSTGTPSPSQSPSPSPSATSTGSSAYLNAVMGSSPAGYWRLGEKSGTTAVDATGSDNGTYTTGVKLGSPSLVPSQTDTSVVPSSTGAASIPNTTALSPTAKLSVEAWFKADALPATGSWASLVTKTESYSLQFNGPRLEFTLINSSATRFRLQAPSGAVAVGTAYHVVGTWDGTTQRLYLNGSQVASATPAATVRSTTYPLRLGTWDGTSSEVLKGTLDDVSVYGTALTASQVNDHYAAGTATQSALTYPVALTVNGNGTGKVTSGDGKLSCPGTCSYQYPADQTVTLTATPGSGSVFAGWSDGCSGNQLTCTIRTYAATSVTATFSANGTPATLSVTKVGTGTVTSSPAGISCGTTCSTTVAVGTVVTLTAGGGTFSSWAGACSGSATTCTLTVTRDTTVSATFSP